MKAIVPAAGLPAIARPRAAEAHLVNTGFGAYYDGVVHVAITPADLLLVLAVALFAGQRGTRAARWVLFAVPLAWLAGGAIGATFPAVATPAMLTTLTFGAVGALVALNVDLPDEAVAALAAVAGLLHGCADGSTVGPGGAGGLALLGAATAVFCLVAILAAQVTRLQVPWTRVAVRVAGSWIAASGVLMLGWLARSGSAGWT